MRQRWKLMQARQLVTAWPTKPSDSQVRLAIRRDTRWLMEMPVGFRLLYKLQSNGRTRHEYEVQVDPA